LVWHVPSYPAQRDEADPTSASPRPGRRRHGDTPHARQRSRRRRGMVHGPAIHGTCRRARRSRPVQGSHPSARRLHRRERRSRPSRHRRLSCR